jgi:hypothetical protein
MSDIDQQRAETIAQARDLLTAAKDAGRLPGLLMVMLDGQGGYKSVWWTDEVTQTASLIGVAHVDLTRMIGRLVDNVVPRETTP